MDARSAPRAHRTSLERWVTMAWVQQKKRSGGGTSAAVRWRLGGSRSGPMQTETFSAGSDDQNLARRGLPADGGGGRARVARWLGQGHGLRPATPGRRPDATAADGGGGRRGVRPPDRGPLSWPAEALPRPGPNP